MSSASFGFNSANNPKIEELTTQGAKLLPEIEHIKEVFQKQYESDYASLYLPHDQEMINKVKKLCEEKRVLKPDCVIIIGMGGSTLGTQALLHAADPTGIQYNAVKNPKIHFADTTDSDQICLLLKCMEIMLTNGLTILLNVVSKSGTTLETIANAQLFISVLKELRPHSYRDHIVVTTDYDSSLWKLAVQEKYTRLAIPQNVGGRFSVFSPVSLFPLGIIDPKNIDVIIEGARAAQKTCLNEDIKENPAALSALLIAHHYHQKRYIHDTFLFSSQLEDLGKWYRQLLGESIGKEYDRDKKEVHVGITPTVSIGPVDLHSVGQLYLAGPDTTLTTFVTVAQPTFNTAIKKEAPFDTHMPMIQDTSLAQIHHAIMQGVLQSYHANKKPFMQWTLPERRYDTVSYFLQCKMIEIMYLGYLLNVNPFDQPHVEQYKTHTREILSHE